MRDEAAEARRVLVFLALAAALVRLIPAGLIHLTEDEAYYRLWAQHLQFGYYDHPPMIAWWIWLGERICGDTALGARLLPSLASGASTWFVGDLALRLGRRRADAVRAAVWYNATLTVALGGFLATPDAPASLFWILTLWCLAPGRADSTRWWAAAGLAAGLGAISKYSDLFLAPGLLAWVLTSREGRGRLLRPGPWLATAIAATICLPNVVWNAQHGWITFAKQYGRVEASGLRLDYLPELLLTQFFLVNPVIAIWLGRAGVRQAAALRRGEADDGLRLPLVTAAPFLAYLVLHSLHDRVQGHWPAPVYGALAICAAAEAGGAGGRWGRVSRRLAPGLAAALAGFVFIHLAMPGVGALGVSDPAVALSGWPRFATEVEQARVSSGAGWVGTLSYGLAAQLEDERKSAAPILQVNERLRYRGFAAPPPGLAGPGLLIDLDRRVDPADLSRCFGVVQPVGELERGYRQGPLIRYAMFRVAQPRRDLWSDGCHMRNEVVPHF
ncbi:MAG: glycosyltransferase family 39 protein [Alphaproteobacteria bacterium]|nr:glycosyltransferase family 39 protein [Alphaproteobacteria bacterium]